MAPKRQDDRSIDSWGARPRPKGLGTKHLHFDVPNSGYLREAISAETHTRNIFYDTKYMLSRPPNTVFGETPEDVRGQYLVPVPPDHECFGTPSMSNIENTLRGRTAELVSNLQQTQSSQHDAARQLQSRIAKDQLIAKRNAVFAELRQVDVLISKDAWDREKGLIDPYPFPDDLVLPNRGLKTTLMAYPSQRSKPKFTTRIPGLGFP
jgi:hypothetical protein